MSKAKVAAAKADGAHVVSKAKVAAAKAAGAHVVSKAKLRQRRQPVLMW